MKTSFDPVMLEVMNNELGAIGDEMAFALRRTARSFAGREGGDFMVGLLDSDGNLIARSQYALDKWNIVTTMPSVRSRYPAGLQKGDIYISNDPYGGGDHLNDITLIMPIYWQDELVAYAGDCLHAADIGGRPGGMSAYAQSVFEEGVRLPGVLLHKAGVENDALIEVLRANSRAPEDLLGDLEAQVVALRRGEEGYHRLIRKYGIEAVKAFGQHLLDYTERQVRTRIASLPQGEWFAEEQFEDDGTGQRPGPLVVERLKIKDGTITFDSTGSSPQSRNAINRPPGLVPSRGSDIVRHVLGLDIPMNSGVLRCIKVVAPEGTVINPRFPAAVGARAYLRAEALTTATFAMAAPERIPAGGTGSPGVMIFTTREHGSPQVLFDLYQNGSGARPTKDGMDGGGRATGGGGLNATPAELIERQHPVIVEGFGFAPDTGGAGKFRGAVSIYRKWRFLKDGSVNIRFYFCDKTAYGLAGGKNGTMASITLERASKLEELPVQSHLEFEVRAGDVLTHIHAGPGGHGAPLERDAQLVLDDVLDEKMTIPYAAKEYGVVIDPEQFHVDQERTAKLRKEIKKAMAK